MALGWRKNYIRYKGFFLNILEVYKNRKDVRMFLELLLSLTSITFFSVFALRPTLLTIAQLLKDIKLKEESLAIMDQKIQDLSNANTLAEKESTKILKLATSVPDFPNPDSIIRQIESLSVTHSLTLQGLTIDEASILGERSLENNSDLEPMPEGSKGLRFSFSVRGSFEQVSAFINDIQNLGRPVKTDNITINSFPSETESSLVLVLEGRVPYLENK